MKILQDTHMENGHNSIVFFFKKIGKMSADVSARDIMFSSMLQFGVLDLNEKKLHVFK